MQSKRLTETRQQRKVEIRNGFYASYSVHFSPQNGLIDQSILGVWAAETRPGAEPWHEAC
jgi:hypothetical protein